MLALTLSRSALAQEAEVAHPCPTKVPHLEVQLQVADLDLAQDTWVDLASGMRQRHVVICDEPGFREGRVGKVEVTVVDGGARVRVIDALTDKELVRRVKLEEVPPDGRSLLLAVTAEELVRASWAELAFRPGDEAFSELALAARRDLEGEEETEPPPVPAPVPSSLATPPEDSAPPDEGGLVATAAWRLGVLGAGEHFTGGPTLLGADLFVRRALVDRLALSLEGFARSGLAQQTPLGTVGAVVVGGGLSLVGTVWRAEPFALRLDGGLRLGWARFEGDAQAPVTSLVHEGAVVLLRGGVAARWAMVDALRLVVRVNGGAPVRAVAAASDGVDLTGLMGAELGGGLGLETAF